MRRHDTDLTSLLAGLVFAVLALVALVGPVLNVDVDAAWVVPVVLIGAGVAGLVVTWARLRQERGSD